MVVTKGIVSHFETNTSGEVAYDRHRLSTERELRQNWNYSVMV